MKSFSVEFLGGSGFFVTHNDCGFLFDASLNGNDERIFPDPESLSSLNHLYLFISHHHGDHYDPSILDRCPMGRTTIFMGFDIIDHSEGIRLRPLDQFSSRYIEVRAFGSTDDGISFFVKHEGLTLFHAGDLNLWHWRDTSTVAEIEEAEKLFTACVEPIPKDEIDLCFFPVDPRQGTMYDAGAGYFIMSKRPKVMIPMHFHGRTDAALRFALTGETPYTKVIAMEHPRDTVQITL